jgi:2'-5' RNA ligase
MPRVFFAIRAPKPIAGEIHSHFMRRLSASPFLKLVDPRTLHITTHFVGNLIEEQYEILMDDFLHMDFPAAHEVSLGGNAPLSTFGERVLFVRVQENDFLRELHGASFSLFPKPDLEYARTGEYRPHLTLARNPSPHGLRPIIKEFSRHAWEKKFIPRSTASASI